MSIYKKLNEARKQFHQRELKKSGHNKFAGYYYFELGDFLIPAIEIFDKLDLCALVSFPVAKIMDYGKFIYQEALKARENRRSQVNAVVKEMKLRPRIESHDYDTKKSHIERFLLGGDKVKVTIMFRGREQSRPEMGYKLLARLAEDLAEVSMVEFAPKQDGRNMVMVLAPNRRKSEAVRAKQVVRDKTDKPSDTE